MNEIAETLAIRFAATFLFNHFKDLPCDNDGVASCIRCNAIYLARRCLELTTAKSSAEQT